MDPRRLLFSRIFRKQRLSLLEGFLGISWMIGLVKIIEHSGYGFGGFVIAAVSCCLLTGLVGSISVMLVAYKNPEDVTGTDYLHGFIAGLVVLPGMFVVALLAKLFLLSLFVIVPSGALYFLYLVCFTSRVTFGGPSLEQKKSREDQRALEERRLAIAATLKDPQGAAEIAACHFRTNSDDVESIVLHSAAADEFSREDIETKEFVELRLDKALDIQREASGR